MTGSRAMSKDKYLLKNLATGKTSELEALSGTVGPHVINIGSLWRDQDRKSVV